MDISIVILTWNSVEYFQSCFDSVVKFLDVSGLNYEIFIVDNGSTDRTIELLQQYESNLDALNVTYLNENVGTTKSRNMALEKCCGRYICIMDSDVELKQKCF